MSFVSSGGVPIPVQEEPAIQFVFTPYTDYNSLFPDGQPGCWVGVTLTGFAPDAALVLRRSVILPDGRISGPITSYLMTDSEGNADRLGGYGILATDFQGYLAYATVTDASGAVVSTPTVPVAC